MQISENALVVLERRYLTRDTEGNLIESPEGLFGRVATALADPDLNYDKNADTKALAEEFYEVMTSLRFLPNSPTLMNAGKELGQLSACFVLPVEDSMDRIFDTIKQAALIHKSGGGTGFFLLPAAAERECCANHRRCGFGPHQFYARLQRRHRSGETGRYPPRRQYGHSAGGSSRYFGIYRLQSRR